MIDSNVLGRGDQVPHVAVTLPDGRMFTYTSIWQQKNLVLVAVGDPIDGSRYAAALSERQADFDRLQTVCVVTSDSVPGLPAPGALVADRWGEIVHTALASQVSELPQPSDFLDWVDWISRRCS